MNEEKKMLETYSKEFLDEINKTEVYKPSLLFGWQDIVMGKLSKWLNEDNDIIYGEEQLKYLAMVVGLFTLGFCGVVLGIVIWNGR